MLNEKNEGKLLENLESIASSLERIALFRALDALYSSTVREELVSDYDALMKADAEAYAALETVRASMGESLGWEARVEKYGEDEALRQVAPMTDARDKRRETMENVNAFEKRHPLIQRLTHLYPVAFKGVAR